MRLFRFISTHFSRISQKPFHKNPNLIISQSKSKPSNFMRRCTTATVQQPNTPPPPPPASDKVAAIVDEISELTLLEISDLTELLRQKLDVKEMPVMAVMMPGMAFGGLKGPAAKSAGGAAAKGEEKAEKTAFDVKLEGFDAAAKIKVIKEVRAFTDLGLKEAKDLVEKAPTLLKKGVSKEEAEKIVQKMKEVGAKVSME